MEGLNPAVTCCSEKIIIFIDQSPAIDIMELNVGHSTTGEGQKSGSELVTAFQRLKKVVRMFIQLKKMIAVERDDEYCFLLQDEEGRIQAIPSKGLSEAEVVLNELKRVDNDRDTYGANTDTLKLNEIVKKCLDLVPDKQPVVGLPPYLIRLILFISRSSGEVVFDETDLDLNTDLSNPFLFVDTLYVHDHPNSDNHVEKIFRTLQLLNVNGLGYSLECGPDVNSWHRAMADLLAHPLLRKPRISTGKIETHARTINGGSSGDQGSQKMSGTNPSAIVEEMISKAASNMFST